MRFPIYIALRWTHKAPEKHTRNIIGLGIACIALCCAIMVITVCTLTGFKSAVSNKVFGFGSHLQLRPYDSDGNTTYLELPKDVHSTVFNNTHIERLDPFLHKEFLAKSSRDETFGLFFKGVSSNYDSIFFSKYLISGSLPVYSPEKMSLDVLISQKIARLLDIEVGDKFISYFTTKNSLRPRQLRVSGIYKTGMTNFDDIYVVGDAKAVQKLLGLNSDEYSGYDIKLYNPNERHSIRVLIERALPYEWSCYVSEEIFPEVFDWLSLIDVNVWVLLIILWAVALISLMSILFICLTGRRTHSFILYAVGLNRKSLLKIFYYQAIFILGRGILIGNLIGLLICLAQYYTQAIKLNEEVYFVSHVPISFNFYLITLMNIICVALAALMLFCIVFSIRNTRISDIKNSSF